MTTVFILVSTIVTESKEQGVIAFVPFYAHSSLKGLPAGRIMQRCGRFWI